MYFFSVIKKGQNVPEMMLVRSCILFWKGNWTYNSAVLKAESPLKSRKNLSSKSFKNMRIK